jgi:hypothetical protein
MSDTKPKKQATKKAATKVEAPEVEAPKTEAPKAKDVVVFISREKEPVQFNIRDRYAHRREDGRLRWRFSAEEAVLVRRHHYVQMGRVVEE